MEHKVTISDIHKILAQPAVRALQNAEITSIDILCSNTEEYLLSLHGFGKNGLQRIKQYLCENGLSLKK